MPLFIVFSLALSFMVQNAGSLQSLLVTPLLIDICLGIAIISILGSMFKKRWRLIWYDIFSSSTLLIWFAYWKPLFKDDSPIFFFYPLYFALVTAFVSLFFIGQRHKIDEESFRFMRSYSKKKPVTVLDFNGLCFRQFRVAAKFYVVSRYDDTFNYALCFNKLHGRPRRVEHSGFQF